MKKERQKRGRRRRGRESTQGLLCGNCVQSNVGLLSGSLLHGGQTLGGLLWGICREKGRLADEKRDKKR